MTGKEPKVSENSAADGIVEGTVPEGYSERLYNEDLRPLRQDERGWTTYSLFCTWMADVHSIGGYTFAAGLFFLGLTGWQVLLALICRDNVGVFPDQPHERGGTEARHPLPRIVQDRLRGIRGQHSGPDQGGHRYLLVRHPDLAGLRGGRHPRAEDLPGFATLRGELDSRPLDPGVDLLSWPCGWSSC